MANVTFVSNPQASPACYPADVNAMLHLIAEGGGLSGTIPDNSGGGLYVGTIPPASSLTNRVWFVIDGAGRPLGIKMFYNGNWRKVYTGVGLGEIRMMYYAPSEFDGTGRGIVGGNWDGWALCNGQNGTPDLHDHFPVAALSYSGGWQSTVEGAAHFSGGAAHQPISPANLPYLSTWLSTAPVAAGSGANGVGSGAPGQGPGHYQNVTGLNNVPLGGAPLETVPPYVSLGFVMFVGFA